MFLIVAIGRYLGLSLFAREQAQFRDAAVARLGADLLGMTDPSAIDDRAWAAVADFCDVTPGLHVLRVEVAGGIATVTRAWGYFKGPLPAALPLLLFPNRAKSGDTYPFAGHAFMRTAVGSTDNWVCAVMPQGPRQWAILGAPSSLLPDVLLAFASATAQVALAVRNSESHRSLATAATTDALTGLANRAAFTAELDARDPTAGMAVLFIDLDGFKQINDSFGHAAGDGLLRVVGHRLAAESRTDDFCGRLGGDEFAVLIRDPRPGVAESIAERLVDLIAAPVQLAGQLASVSASVGLAFSHPQLSGEQLVQRADVAMYAAKAGGKSRVQTYEPHLTPADRRAALPS